MHYLHSVRLFHVTISMCAGLLYLFPHCTERSHGGSEKAPARHSTGGIEGSGESADRNQLKCHMLSLLFRWWSLC